MARFIRVYQGMPEQRRAEYEAKLKGGYRALELMNNHLLRHDFLAGESCTIADLSLFAYTHVAPEGGFDLAPYTAILDWIDRIRGLPGFVAMPPSANRTPPGAG